MRRDLIERLSEVTDEERLILLNSVIDKKLYTADESFIINGARLDRGKFGVIMRTHPRYTAFPLHSHNFSEMMIVLSGKIVHTVGEERIALCAGDILLLNKHASHSIAMTDTSDLGVNLILSDRLVSAISPELSGTVFSGFFDENAKADGRAAYLHFRAGGDPVTENLAENLIEELSESTPDGYVTEKTLSLLLYRLSRLRDSFLKNKDFPRDKESRRRLEILSYVKSSYRTATLTELAERLYITPEHLSKLVRRYFGKSFKELVMEERIERAIDLLVNTDVPIGDVIRNMGYENESYFHREFKKRVGLTPKEMRFSKKNGKNDKI